MELSELTEIETGKKPVLGHLVTLLAQLQVQSGMISSITVAMPPNGWANEQLVPSPGSGAPSRAA